MTDENVGINLGRNSHISYTVDETDEKDSYPFEKMKDLRLRHPKTS